MYMDDTNKKKYNETFLMLPHKKMFRHSITLYTLPKGVNF